jgi:hypothetical protein
MVVNANLGTGIVAATASTTQKLPSNPTGRVNNGAVLMGGSAGNWGSAVVLSIALLLGLELMA